MPAPGRKLPRYALLCWDTLYARLRCAACACDPAPAACSD